MNLLIRNAEVLEAYIRKKTVLLDKQTKKQVCLTNAPMSGPLLDFQKATCMPPHATSTNSRRDAHSLSVSIQTSLTSSS